jgi:hypothetical protein
VLLSTALPLPFAAGLKLWTLKESGSPNIVLPEPGVGSVPGDQSALLFDPEPEAKDEADSSNVILSETEFQPQFWYKHHKQCQNLQLLASIDLARVWSRCCRFETLRTRANVNRTEG